MRKTIPSADARARASIAPIIHLIVLYTYIYTLTHTIIICYNYIVRSKHDITDNNEENMPLNGRKSIIISASLYIKGNISLRFILFTWER